MARLREYKRVNTGSVSPDLYKNLNQAFNSWSNAYKKFRKTGSALAFYEARRAGTWYKKYGGKRSITIPKVLKLEADEKKSRIYRSKKTGKLVKVEPPKPKKRKKSKKK